MEINCVKACLEWVPWRRGFRDSIFQRHVRRPFYAFSVLYAVNLLAGADPRSDTVAANEHYEVIVERNAFRLRTANDAAPDNPASVAPPVEVKDDLLLTGWMAGPSSNRRAFFTIMTPGRTPRYFSLGEGEANEWLELRTMQPEKRTVTALLKKPVVRARTTGAEIALSFDVHGANPQVAAALSKAEPLPPQTQTQSALARDRTASYLAAMRARNR